MSESVQYDPVVRSLIRLDNFTSTLQQLIEWSAKTKDPSLSIACISSVSFFVISKVSSKAMCMPVLIKVPIRVSCVSVLFIKSYVHCSPRKT